MTSARRTDGPARAAPRRVASRIRGRAGVPALAVVAAAVLAGCGYKTTRLVEQPGVFTVAVAQFDNEGFRRDLELRLTKMVAEEVRARTPWRIASVATADAVLTGTIRSAEVPVIAESGDVAATPVMKRYRATVEGTLVDRRTGKVLRSFTVGERQDFAPGRYGESEDASATDTILRALAQDVVHALERPVGEPDAVPPDKKRAIPPWSWRAGERSTPVPGPTSR